MLISDFKYVDNSAPKRAKYKARADARGQELYSNSNTRQAYLDKLKRIGDKHKNNPKLANSIRPGSKPINIPGSAKGNVNLTPFQKFLRKMSKSYSSASPEGKLFATLVGASVATAGIGVAANTIPKLIPNRVKSEVVVRKESRAERKTREDKGRKRGKYRNRK